MYQWAGWLLADDSSRDRDTGGHGQSREWCFKYAPLPTGANPSADSHLSSCLLRGAHLRGYAEDGYDGRYEAKIWSERE